MAVELDSRERNKAHQLRALSGKVVYHAVLHEADAELARASQALFWSALATGLAMGLSLPTELSHIIAGPPRC